MSQRRRTDEIGIIPEPGTQPTLPKPEEISRERRQVKGEILVDGAPARPRSRTEPRIDTGPQPAVPMSPAPPMRIDHTVPASAPPQHGHTMPAPGSAYDHAAQPVAVPRDVTMPAPISYAAWDDGTGRGPTGTMVARAPEPPPSAGMLPTAMPMPTAVTFVPPGSPVAMPPLSPMPEPISPRVQTLPGLVPFRAPIRGQIITNGQHGVYFLGDHVGSGAFGDVYECTDEWSNPLVAKVLKPSRSFEEVRQQWISEVANLDRMRHPNITYIYDAFLHENAFFIVVEKCLFSLDRVIDRVTPSWAPYIARDVLQALSFIHRLGHVHKDVHVGNVFVSVTTDAMDQSHAPRVSFKLGDLGIARLESEIRAVGTILAPWMQPPEALDPATFGAVSRPTDVYHAALLLLAVLRREVYPFTEHDIVHGLPRDFAERTGWPAAMALSNALHPHVGRRTQSPLEFWREISSALHLAG